MLKVTIYCLIACVLNFISGNPSGVHVSYAQQAPSIHEQEWVGGYSPWVIIDTERIEREAREREEKAERARQERLRLEREALERKERERLERERREREERENQIVIPIIK